MTSTMNAANAVDYALRTIAIRQRAAEDRLRRAAGDMPPEEYWDAANEDRWGRLPHEPGYGRPPLTALPGGALPDVARRAA